MDPELLKEVYHWAPTPLITFAFLVLLRRSLSEFEGRLAGVVVDLKDFLKNFNTHERRVDRIEERVEEMWKARKDAADLRVEVERLKSYLWGSGPKRNPLLRSPEGDE